MLLLVLILSACTGSPRPAAETLLSQAVDLNNEGWEAYQKRQYALAETKLAQALQLSQSLDAGEAQAVSHQNLGLVYLSQARPYQARLHFQAAFDLFQADNQPRGAAQALLNLAALEQESGNQALAHQQYQRALTISRRVGYRAGEAAAQNGLGGLFAANKGEGDKALGLYEEALGNYRAAADPAGEAAALANIGKVHLDRGNYAAAVSFLERALTLDKKLENQEAIGAELHALGRAHLGRKDYGEAAQYFHRAYGVSIALDKPERAARDLGGWARALSLQNLKEEARQLLLQARSHLQGSRDAALIKAIEEQLLELEKQ